MRFEAFEPRIVMDAALGDAVEFDIDTTVDVAPPATTPALPNNIQYRETDDDFVYSSEDLDPAFIDQLVSTSESWRSRPETARAVDVSDTSIWRKTINTYPPRFHPDGYFVAERFEGYHNSHTLLYATKRGSDDFALGGTYMKQDYHYKVSFDVRHPETELSWLTQKHWAIVTQFWGPRESGETARNPPFAIYSGSIDGVPHWIIRSLGDSRRITQTGEFEEEHIARIPMTNIGDWNTWDIEFVPNPFGQGVIRTWLNGELVSEWVDIKSNYFSIYGDVEVGPLNPSFGLYSSMIEDGMEAHFDNIEIESNGLYQSSISGTVTGMDNLEGLTVFATNVSTGQRYGNTTGSSGVYSLAVPKGIYTVTAVNSETGHQESVGNVDTRSVSKLVNLDVTDVPPPPAPALLTTTGDLNGDGKADIINRLADGSWQVTLVGVDNDVSPQLRTPRDPDAEEPVEQPTTPEPEAPPAAEPPADGLMIGESEIWTTWSTNVTWKEIFVADFTGDGLDDIAGLAENGQWWIAQSTGDGFQNRLWGKWSPQIEWFDMSVGDFNGDGKADVVARAATNASWWVGTSDGTKFTNTEFGRWTLNVDWQSVMIGDYNGDGLDDIAGRAGRDGTWWVSQSTGTRFQNSYFGKFTTIVEWSTFAVGDFNGDGKDDILGRAASDGTMWVGVSSGTRFHNSYYGRLPTFVNWLDISIADVDGDGKDDVVTRAESDGSWWGARSIGDRFQNFYWGAVWSKDVDWIAAAVADFDGDGKADLLGANTENWWLSN